MNSKATNLAGKPRCRKRQAFRRDKTNYIEPSVSVLDRKPEVQPLRKDLLGFDDGKNSQPVDPGRRDIGRFHPDFCFGKDI